MLPVATPSQLVLASGLTPDQVYKALKWLSKHELAVHRSLFGYRRKGRRYWLTRTGVFLATREHGLPITWQVSAEGIRWLVRRLPVADLLYNQALGLGENRDAFIELAPLPQNAYVRPRDLPEEIDLNPVAARNPRALSAFRWYQGEGIDAAAEYQHRWYAMLWAGPEATHHQLGRRVNKAIAMVRRAWGCAIFCADVLAAAHAAHWTQGHNATGSDGRWTCGAAHAAAGRSRSAPGRGCSLRSGHSRADSKLAATGHGIGGLAPRAVLLGVAVRGRASRMPAGSSAASGSEKTTAKRPKS